MDIARIALLAAVSLLLGVALAAWGELLPVRPGFVAGPALVGAVLLARAYWARRRRVAGDEPSPAERKLWLHLAGNALIVGFVVRVLAEPGSEVHRSTGDTGGLDSWLMVAGAAVAWWLLREPGDRHDERDRDIAAFGDRVGYWALVTLLLGFLLTLGFAPPGHLDRFTHWLIANALLVLIIAAGVVQYAAQLARYARERRLDHQDGTP